MAGWRRMALPTSVVVCATVCLMLWCAPGLVSKEKKITKTISGVVLDAADNPIAGATVELNDVNAGKKLAKYSQEEGKYKFADLDPKHEYEVQASFKGLTSEVHKVSSIDDRPLIVVNLTLSPQQ